MSLGVDLVPHKVCSLDCVYCECGPTTKLTLDRMEYVLYRNVTEELEHYFTENPDPDYITFSGSGEPTLNSRIGDVLRFIKQKKPAIPVAVLTNGTLLGRTDVQAELMEADVVLPSLDAATESTFRRINRPAALLNLQDYLEGLVRFRKIFTGEIWLEVFIIPGYNDHPEEVEAIGKVIGRIGPDRIQLNSMDRPGAEEGLEKAGYEALLRIADSWAPRHVEIISRPVIRKDSGAYRKDLESAIMETILRRPCTAEDLGSILDMHQGEVNKYLDVLEAEGRIQPFRQERGIFYRPL
jgi:wyosine [tRNA(Phe)-imidazoG37] synthetase (radical SAM superfamily)